MFRTQDTIATAGLYTANVDGTSVASFDRVSGALTRLREAIREDWGHMGGEFVSKALRDLETDRSVDIFGDTYGVGYILV